ncbi:MAG: transposase domain-containing protein, partial [Chloroflexota bacterium]
MEFAAMSVAFAQISVSFSFAPFSHIFQPLVEEVLTEQGQDQYRQGTILTPPFLIWLVLALTLRRDLNYPKVLNWMISGFRWNQRLLPPQADVV